MTNALSTTNSRASFLRISSAFATTAAISPLAASSAEQRMALKWATIASDSGSQPFYAEAMGFFKNAGLDVQVNVLSSGPTIVPAILSGSVDIGGVSIGSIGAAVAHGLPLVIVAPSAMYNTMASTTSLVVKEKSTIRAAADLNGKTIGVNGLSDLIYIATRSWISKNGGDANSMKFIEIPFADHGPALQRGTIDAIATAEPVITVMRLHYGARVLANPYDIVNAKKPFMIAAWVATADWAKSHPAVLKAFATGLNATSQWANGNQTKSATILSKYLALDPDVLKGMARCTFSSSLDASSIQPPLDLYYEAKQLPKPVDAGSLIYSALA